MRTKAGHLSKADRRALQAHGLAPSETPRVVVPRRSNPTGQAFQAISQGHWEEKGHWEAVRRVVLSDQVTFESKVVPDYGPTFEWNTELNTDTLAQAIRKMQDSMVLFGTSADVAAQSMRSLRGMAQG